METTHDDDQRVQLHTEKEKIEQKLTELNDRLNKLALETFGFVPSREELRAWLTGVLDEEDGPAEASTSAQPPQDDALSLSQQFEKLEIQVFGCPSSEWYQELDTNELPYNSARLTTEMVENYVPSADRKLTQDFKAGLLQSLDENRAAQFEDGAGPSRGTTIDPQSISLRSSGDPSASKQGPINPVVRQKMFGLINRRGSKRTSAPLASSPPAGTWHDPSIASSDVARRPPNDDPNTRTPNGATPDGGGGGGGDASASWLRQTFKRILGGKGGPADLTVSSFQSLLFHFF